MKFHLWLAACQKGRYSGQEYHYSPAERSQVMEAAFYGFVRMDEGQACAVFL